MALTLVQAPQSLPVSVQELRDQLRVGLRTEETSLLTRAVRAATAHAERSLRRALITQTWKETASAFPCGTSWRLAKPPLTSVTSVTCVDATGTPVTFASSSYVVDAPAGPNPVHGRVVLADGQSWPTPPIEHPAAAAVTFVCGYGATAAAVPEDIRLGILMLASHFYEHREPVVVGTIVSTLPMTVEALWSPYRAQVWS